jgi:hypothetical protein
MESTFAHPSDWNALGCDCAILMISSAFKGIAMISDSIKWSWRSEKIEVELRPAGKAPNTYAPGAQFDFDPLRNASLG